MCAAEEEKNQHARAVVDRIMHGATWVNIHSLPHELKIVEMRTIEGSHSIYNTYLLCCVCAGSAGSCSVYVRSSSQWPVCSDAVCVCVYQYVHTF